MQIRLLKQEDLPAAEKIYADARSFMKRIGNPDQWKDHWPPMDRIRQDIRDGIGYAVEENGEVLAVFACWYGDHAEPSYRTIYDGAWLEDSPYAVIHRIAAKEGSHAGSFAIQRTVEQYRHVRIDTHEQNKAMRHRLMTLGFTECGRILLENGEERIAYERVDGSKPDHSCGRPSMY